MATVSDLIEETRRHLFSGKEEEKNRLSGAVTDSATNMSMTYELKGISAGATIAIDLEEIRVWETGGSSITVERGINGSTPAAHADLATVTVRPKFSNFRILQALNNDLRDLSSPINGLYQVVTQTLTYNAAVMGYDIPAAATNSIMGIIDVAYGTPDVTVSLPRLDGYSLRRNMTTDFPSGLGIVFYDQAVSGYPIRLTMAASFGTWSDLTDTHATVGLSDTAVDLPPLGAAIRLVSPRDVKRGFSETQGEPRRADEVAVGAGTSSMRGLMMLRAERILAEAARLERLYPKMHIGY